MLLSLDTSLGSSGYCVFDNEGLIVEYGRIPTDKKDFENEDLRCNYIGNVVQELINKHNIDEIVSEDQYSSVNPKTVLSLRKLIGVISRVAYNNGIVLEYYYPTAWRKILGINKGKANEKKQLAYDYVTKRGVDIGEFKTSGKKKTDDIADSICIGFAYLKERGRLNGKYK